MASEKWDLCRGALGDLWAGGLHCSGLSLLRPVILHSTDWHQHCEPVCAACSGGTLCRLTGGRIQLTLAL